MSAEEDEKSVDGKRMGDRWRENAERKLKKKNKWILRW